MADAERCIAFMRAFAERRAWRVVSFRFGDVTFLTADENRWPKELYAKLGFEPVARVWDFGKGDLV